MTNAPNNAILTVRQLRAHFPVQRGMFGRTRGRVRAVDGVDFTLARGRTLGLVGESGSGKTTIARALLRLAPTAQVSGAVTFDGHDVFATGDRALRRLRRRMQIIFQDPVGSLNPRMTVQHIVAEPLVVHSVVPRRRRAYRVGQLLERVGLSPGCGGRYPHEFSGGQRQRIGIARALAGEPDFIVCDEPVSALDVSIQAQILNLLKDLQAELGLSYLLIAHNLAVVQHMADEVAILYLGRIVETAPAAELLSGGGARHPYTESLLAAIPQPDPSRRRSCEPLPGEMPSPLAPPSGCAFHPRCPLTRRTASDLPARQQHILVTERASAAITRRCVAETPHLKPVLDHPGHSHACLLRQDMKASGAGIEHPR